MGERERLNNISLQVFADRFQKEKLGLVYYPRGLGRGGRVVTYDEAIQYVEEYNELLARNKRWLTLSAKIMIAGLLIGALIGFLWSAFAAAIMMSVAVGLYFTSWVNAMFGSSLFEMRVARELGRRIASVPLNRKDRIERGFARPHWKNLLFYGVGGPLLLFFMLHRAGPHGLVSLLGPELARKYDLAITLFVIGVFLFALVALPFMWWQSSRRARNQNSTN